MTNYTMSILSFKNHSIDVISKVLMCEPVSKLILPATILLSPEKELFWETASDFRVSDLSDEFYSYDKKVLYLPLSNNEGITLSFNLYLTQTTVPNCIVVKFTDRHLQEGIVSLPHLMQLIEQLTPIFEVDQALVYDTPITKLGRKRQYFRDNKKRSHPRELAWINFFGQHLVDFIGRDRFKNLKSCAEKYELHGGIVVILQKEPFDESNPVHHECRIKAEAELGLQELP